METTIQELETLAAEKGVPVYQILDEIVEEQLKKAIA